MTYGKSALITGAAQGIGAATAKQLASQGVSVCLVDRDVEKLKAFGKELEQYGGKVLCCECDVRDEDKVRQTAAYALEQFGRMDILVNNAGIFREDVMPFEESKSEYWKKKIEINVLGTMYFTHAILSSMLDNGYGRIVNLSSIASVFGLGRMVDYSMSKGAIDGFTKALAREVTGRGVCVNAVAPGLIGGKAEKTDWNCIGRNGTYEECANLICFLASDEARYISGQIYVTDGLRHHIQ